ncbi:MAG: hypothetical protein HWE34_09125 [Methylocystaceae bacterium]|nr:hypothetical protein [Methylocystaceae bacterium]
MNENDQELSHLIKLKFGTRQPGPSQIQIDAIKADIRKLISSGRTPTFEDLSRIVHIHCPDAGTCGYYGEDNTDLNTLLLLILKK